MTDTEKNSVAYRARRAIEEVIGISDCAKDIVAELRKEGLLVPETEKVD